MPRGFSQRELEGELRSLPFTGQSLQSAISDEFLELRNAVDEGTLLVITRSPTELQEVETALTGGVEEIQPNESQSLVLETITGHALETLNDLVGEENEISRIDSDSGDQGNYTIVGGAKLHAFLIEFERNYDWETEYLELASDKPSFYSDLSSFITDALTRRTPVESSDPILSDIGTFTESFHQHLLDKGFIAEPAVRREVVQQLSRSTDPDIQADGVLVVGFEEFTPVEREYLRYVSHGAYLRCICRRDSSVFRTWSELGRIEDKTGLEVNRIETPGGLRSPSAVAN